MSSGISIWAASAAEQLENITTEPVYTKTISDFQFEVHSMPDAVWLVATSSNAARMAFRIAYAPESITLEEVTNEEGGIKMVMSAAIGTYHAAVSFPEEGTPLLRYTIAFTPAEDTDIPFWPRDIVIPANGSSEGDIHIRQVGTRSGIIYASMTRPAACSFLYLQNLTALADYCNATQTSVADTVGGEWPEFGFSLPSTKDKPLPAGRQVTISDAFVCFSSKTPNDQFEIATEFLTHLSALYLHLPRPETVYHDFPDILAKSLHDLEHKKACWQQHNGHAYLNAYVSDYDTPPEIMVQLAVLLPIRDYTAWSGDYIKFGDDIYDNLKTFYNEELKTVMRWLPALEDQLDESEEQKSPKVMDSWYLHHPLLNLSRLALNGDEIAKELLLNSLEFAIKVAHHFNYRWPVFYNMETLEVVKAETQPGKGGEKDVAGAYAHLMLQAWELTGENRYLDEAKKAALTLQDYGFDIFYQANNTAFSAGAMLRLYKACKEEIYLKLAYLCIANLFKNVALWQCNYGYGKNFPNFFSLFPLNDAPYTAVYEEQEGFSALHDFLMHAQGLELLPAVTLLLPEFIRYTVYRAPYYYPPMLPREMLAEETKTGELDPALWIALEDIHDGWEKSGGVGQEVYGAGLAFGIVPRHYIKIQDASFMVFIDYPVTEQQQNGRQLTFKVLGSKKLSCSMCIVPANGAPAPEISVLAGNEPVKSTGTHEGRITYSIHGNQEVTITWK